MILVDTNIVIAAIRSADPSKLIDLLQLHGGAVCGVVRAELLHGARSPAERQKAMAMLGTLGTVLTPEAIWDDVGDNLSALRGQGVTVPFPDAVIATLAISNGIALWTRDGHFAIIQRALPSLKLFQEPP